MSTKTYGQFCGLARALDHVGDRWTLLVVRELLVADRSYGDLARCLGGVPTNLLAGRLRSMERDGIVERYGDEADRRRVLYRLTPFGAALEPAVLALVRWGAAWMLTGPGEDAFEPHWLLVALRAFLAGPSGSPAAAVAVTSGDEVVAVVRTSGGERSVVAGGTEAEPGYDAVVGGNTRLVLAVAGGVLTLADAEGRGVTVTGDRDAAAAALAP